MAVTASTPANLVIGAGDVYLDGSDLGATQENNVFTIEQEYPDLDLNGVPGSLMGTHYKVRERAYLEMTIPEVSSTIIGAIWPGSQSATAGNVITLDTDGTRRIPTADYHDWQLRVDGLDGKRFDFIADNAINVGNLEFEAADDGALAPRPRLESTWDASDMSSSPHRILVVTGATS